MCILNNKVRDVIPDKTLCIIMKCLTVRPPALANLDTFSFVAHHLISLFFFRAALCVVVALQCWEYCYLFFFSQSSSEFFEQSSTQVVHA